VLSLAALGVAVPFPAAQWIAPQAGLCRPFASPLFRKEFRLAGTPRTAVVRVIGLGDYDLTINGRRMTPTGINQPWSQYDRTLYWSELDAKRLLRPGANCLGVTLGASFWHNPDPPAGRYGKDGPQRTASEPFLLCAELVVTGQDGKETRIATDRTWRVTPGPVTFSHVYAGEDYDARAELPGWDMPGFDDSAWLPARVAEAPKSEMRKRDGPGFGSFEVSRPTSVRTSPDGPLLYAFPANTSAQLRVRLDGGRPGDRVTVRCGEHRNAEGRLFGGYVVECGITTAGKPVDRRWTFFYLGMQFVEVTGAIPEGAPNPDGKPVIRRIELIHVRNGLPQAGTFRCSSDLYNRTHALIDQAMRSNMGWVMTDCPHREKLGWLECAYLLAPSFACRYECKDWFAKIARDIRDAQEPSGMVRTVAPSYPAGRFPGAFDWTVEWGAAAVMLPWIQYQWCGDAAILSDNFGCMRRFVDYVETQARDGIAPGGLGDWYDYGHGHGPGPSRFTPTDLSATATWALCSSTVARAADVLGRKPDAERYRALHARIGAAFARRFIDPVTGRLKTGDSPQCANAMALCADLVPADRRKVMVDEIVADLEKRRWQQTPGDIGHVYLIRALAEAGRSDVLHKVYSRTGTGSYGGIIAKGLTSLPETWDAMMDGYQSLNHCMLGHVIEWFYGYVAGIRQAPGSVGWNEVLIAPQPGPLTSAEATLRTPRGVVACSWRKTDGRFEMVATVPKGVKATAVLPSDKRVTLRAGKQVVAEHQK
jgi:hypothetical protein